MNTLLKLKRKLLKKGVETINSQEVPYEIWMFTCPICKKEYLTVYIDDKVVYGGEGLVFYKGMWVECCEDCMAKAESFIDEIIEKVQNE